MSATAVKGGQMNTSTSPSWSAMSGGRASAKAAASGRVLCIFQLAAQIEVRVVMAGGVLPASRALSVEQRVDAGQVPPLQQFERRAAAG